MYQCFCRVQHVREALKKTFMLLFQNIVLKEKEHLKLNIIGIVGAIIAFVSLVLPWWTMTIFPSHFFSLTTVSIYPYTYQAEAIIPWLPSPFDESGITVWICARSALFLVLIGGVMGIVGSLAQRTRMLLVTGGLLALLSVIIFAVGLQIELSREVAMQGVPPTPTVSLFSSGNVLGSDYITYLSFGSWLALIAGILMLAASRTKQETSSPPAVQQQPVYN